MKASSLGAQCHISSSQAPVALIPDQLKTLGDLDRKGLLASQDVAGHLQQCQGMACSFLVQQQ